MARSQCRFRGFQRVVGQDGQKERAVLAIKIQDWLPFRPSGYLDVSTPKQQLVWAWDKTKADAIIKSQNLNPRRVNFVPESLMVAPGGNQTRLISCLEGFEGQIWIDNSLIESRWWPDVPSSVEWISFQRGAGTKPDQLTVDPPAPVSLPWLDRPWGRHRNSVAGIIAAFEPRDLWMAGAFAMLLPLTFLLVSTVHTQLLLSDTNDRIAKLETAASPVLNAQSAATSGIGQAKALAALDPYLAQITIMGKVAALLPHDGSKFVEWTYQNGELEIGIQNPAPIDARSYVQRFESSGMFKDVSMDRSNPAVSKLKLKVLTKDAIATLSPPTQSPGTPAAPPGFPNIDMSALPPGAKLVTNPAELPPGALNGLPPALRNAFGPPGGVSPLPGQPPLPEPAPDGRPRSEKP